MCLHENGVSFRKIAFSGDTAMVNPPKMHGAHTHSLRMKFRLKCSAARCICACRTHKGAHPQRQFRIQEEVRMKCTHRPFGKFPRIPCECALPLCERVCVCVRVEFAFFYFPFAMKITHRKAARTQRIGQFHQKRTAHEPTHT